MRKALPVLLGITTMLSACSLAPDFELPKDPQVPANFNETALPQTVAPQCHWHEARALTKEDRGQWWKIFEDAKLDELEDQAYKGNQDLKIATAHVAEARAIAESNSLSLLPNLDINGNAQRAKSASTAGVGFGSPARGQKPYTLFNAGGTLSYELDLFGAVRDNYKAYAFDADAQEAAYKSALLSLQADVAQHYFTLRALDAERKLLRETVTIRQEAQRIMQKKLDVGESGAQDITRTISELASTKAELFALDRQRAISEHAIAVLLGVMPEAFVLEENPITSTPPSIPPGLTSDLLLRRPDIAQAQASMAAANTRIGVARAAFFPTISLTSTGGFQSTGLSNLLSWPNRTWALGQTAGSAITMPIFDSGHNLDRLDAAHAEYDTAIASYRQQLLVAFRDVEDNLTSQRLLADQSAEQNNAANASKQTQDIIQKRYNEGDVDFFQVVDAQRDALASARASVQLRGERFNSAIGLIRALGGGWNDVKDAMKEEAPAATPPEAPVAPPATEVDPVVTPAPAEASPPIAAPTIEVTTTPESSPETSKVLGGFYTELPTSPPPAEDAIPTNHSRK